MDRKFILTAFGYALLGLALGLYMAESQNHGQFVTHAHIMLVGFVVTFVYGLCHKLWLNNTTSKLATTQFYVHQAGAIVMFVGLFLLYGGFVAPDKVGPVLGIASFTVFIGLALMAVLFLKSPRRLREGRQRARDHLVRGGQADAEVVGRIHEAARHHEHAPIGERVPLPFGVRARPLDPQVERPLRRQHRVARLR